MLQRSDDNSSTRHCVGSIIAYLDFVSPQGANWSLNFMRVLSVSFGWSLYYPLNSIYVFIWCMCTLSSSFLAPVSIFRSLSGSSLLSCVQLVYGLVPIFPAHPQQLLHYSVSRSITQHKALLIATCNQYSFCIENQSSRGRSFSLLCLQSQLLSSPLQSSALEGCNQVKCRMLALIISLSWDEKWTWKHPDFCIFSVI